MISSTKKNRKIMSIFTYLVASMLFVTSNTIVAAFGVRNNAITFQSKHHHMESSTSLNAAERRHVFTILRRSITGTGAALLSTVTLNRGNNRSNIAHAAEDVSSSTTTSTTTTSGRIVTMDIKNLNGEVGQTGTIKIQLHPEWAPRGVQRFEELTKERFFDGCKMFRVLPGFIAQFGINGNPMIQAKWRSQSIPDDPVKVSNTRGTVVFATAGPNTRTTQIFINTRQQGNTFLDKQGFAPFGEIIEGMDIVDQLYSNYGEGPPQGKGPNQGLIQAKGNEYLEKEYPNLSYVSKATFAE